MCWSWFEVCLAILLILTAVHFSIRKTRKGRLLDLIPGPQGLPILGNALEESFDQVRLFYKARAYAATYKDLNRVWILNIRIVNLYNPDDIEIILSSTKYLEKGLLYTFLRPWLGDGLLLSQGSKWHTRRKILSPAFQPNVLRHFTATIEQQSWQLASELMQRDTRQAVSIQPLVTRAVLLTICETAMGTCLDGDKSVAAMEYKSALHGIGDLILRRTVRAWLHPSWLFERTADGRTQNHLISYLHLFTKLVIKDRRKQKAIIENANIDENDATSGKRRLAMLDLLLQAEKQGLIDHEGIREEVDTFMFEGHDTTAMAIVFGLLELANNKDVQQKVYEEVVSIFGDSNRMATMEDLNNMKYLECCIKETLRLYPSVPMISRRPSRDVKLKNYIMPAGTICNIHIFDLHRRADLWPQPFQYRPERFLDEKKICPFSYIPFSAGPRNCIGHKFAMLQQKSTISAIIRNFSLVPITKPEDVIFVSDIVLRSRDPIYVRFVPRITKNTLQIIQSKPVISLKDCKRCAPEFLVRSSPMDVPYKCQCKEGLGQLLANSNRSCESKCGGNGAVCMI